MEATKMRIGLFGGCYSTFSFTLVMSSRTTRAERNRQMVERSVWMLLKATVCEGGPRCPITKKKKKTTNVPLRRIRGHSYRPQIFLGSRP